jgi:hypothetical protein
MTLWRRWAALSSAWARGRLYDPAAAAAEFRSELAACSDQGATINMAFFQALLAQLETDTMAAETALKRIDDALALACQGDNRCSLSFIHRLRGEILLKRDPSNSAPAEEAFRTAIDVARQQSARSLGLQAALDRPSGRSARRPRARARRLFADAGNARDSRGAGAAIATVIRPLRADSATIGAASGRTGVRPIAAISIGGRNRLQCALVRFPLGYRFVLEISEAARDRPKAVYCRCVRGKYMCSVAGDPQRVGNAAWLCLARCLSRNRLGPPTFWDKMQATALEISRNPFANARRPAVSPKSSGG